MSVRSHLAHLLIYSTLVSSFFALLVHGERRRRIRFGVVAWTAMVGGAILLAWLMFPFPR